MFRKVVLALCIIGVASAQEGFKDCLQKDSISCVQMAVRRKVSDAKSKSQQKTGLKSRKLLASPGLCDGSKVLQAKVTVLLLTSEDSNTRHDMTVNLARAKDSLNHTKKPFSAPSRSTARHANSSSHQRSNWSADSPSSSLPDVTLAHQTLTEPSSNRPPMSNSAKTHWRTSSPREPRASSRNAHWTWTWPAPPVALPESSPRRSSHRSAHSSRKPAARRRSWSSTSSQSSVWSS